MRHLGPEAKHHKHQRRGESRPIKRSVASHFSPLSVAVTAEGGWEEQRVVRMGLLTNHVRKRIYAARIYANQSLGNYSIFRFRWGRCGLNFPSTR
jgi:hypothetical protein